MISATLPIVRCVIATFLVAFGAVRGVAAELQKFIFEKAEMGLPFRITLYASSQESAKAASDAAFARIAALNQIFSDYEDDSELSRLSRTSGSGQKVKVSDALWDVLFRAQQLAEQSGGAFDVT